MSVDRLWWLISSHTHIYIFSAARTAGLKPSIFFVLTLKLLQDDFLTCYLQGVESGRVSEALSLCIRRSLQSARFAKVCSLAPMRIYLLDILYLKNNFRDSWFMDLIAVLKS